MIETTDILLEKLNNYASPYPKLSRMAAHGEIYPIVKGLFRILGNR